jgi:uncharacterized protein
MTDRTTDRTTDGQPAIGVIRRDGRTDPFFDGAAADRLVVRRCEACGLWFAPDTTGCAGCGTDDLVWVEASGEAVLVSWAVAHSPAGETAPLALVELDEGPWMYGRLDGVAVPSEGLPMRVGFVHPDEGESYPVFREHGR